jgi:Protease inhibitor Inh
MSSRFALERTCVALLAAALGACTSSDADGTRPVIGSSLGVPVMAGPPPAPGTAVISAPVGPFGSTPPPFGTPRGSDMPRPEGFERTRSTERTTLSPDGSTLRTERTTTRVGFDPNGAARAVGALVGGAGYAQGLAGAWTMQSSSNGMMCTVFLYGGPGSTTGAATSSGCPMGGIMSGITSWTYAENQLTILKGSATGIVLNQMGPNRFDGTATWGFLSTRIALYR